MEINDPVYGIFQSDELIAAIIRTKLFQRLENVKQLGCCKANHTRLEHCIGTYYSARKFMEYLENNTQNLVIPDFYRKCVEVAALLHDVGHGPFSHFWEKKINPNYRHEEMAKDCVDAIFHEIPLSLSKQFLGEGIDLIKAFITGTKVDIKPKFRFLFEIVNNTQCKIDVDKWDYLKRDKHHMSDQLPEDLKLNLDFDKVFEDARVTSDGEHIQYKYEHYDKIYNIFSSRYKLHKFIYREPKVLVLENILQRALKLAENRGATFMGMKYSEITSSNMEIFLEFTDDNIINNLIEFGDPVVNELIYVYNNPQYIKEFHPSDDDKSNSPKLLIVNQKLEPPGLAMPHDSKICFYGDERAKPKIFNESKHYFRINNLQYNMFN